MIEISLELDIWIKFSIVFLLSQSPICQISHGVFSKHIFHNV